MKEKIDVFDYAPEILKAMKTGILLTTKANEKVNTMTIGWGVLGIEWSTPIFTAFVRENRFTRSCLDKNPEFTVNVPLGDFNKKILGIAGSKSGRNIDKIAELGLHLEKPETISVPGIQEFPLTLECRLLYKQLQDKDAVPDELKKQFYPQDVDGSFPMANRDYHIAYYGEIVSAYIIKPE